MSYHIKQDIKNTKFKLPKDKAPLALLLLQTKLRQNGPRNYHFIDWDDLKSATNLEDALDACRFKIASNEDENYTSIRFLGQGMGGKEPVIFHCLAMAGATGIVPFTGEDGATWEYEMKGGELVGEISVED